MPPERFELRRELMQRADDAAVLCAAVEALLPALHGWLQLHWRAASVLALRLVHEHRREPIPDTVLRLRLSTPSRDAAQLALLWRERLQRQALAAPVYELALVLEESVPHGGTPGELLPRPGSDAAGHAALVDRLVARLGAERVLRFEALPDHRPERAQRAVPATEVVTPDTDAATGATAGSRVIPASCTAAAASSTSGAPGPASVLPAPLRPAWLLEPPEPLASDAYGRPLHGGPLQLCSRAERIEAGWFDGGLARRDYHVALGSDRRLRWIYRERRAGAAAGEAGWFLHGWFG